MHYDLMCFVTHIEPGEKKTLLWSHLFFNMTSIKHQYTRAWFSFPKKICRHKCWAPSEEATCTFFIGIAWPGIIRYVKVECPLRVRKQKLCSAVWEYIREMKLDRLSTYYLVVNLIQSPSPLSLYVHENVYWLIEWIECPF